jgi:hypothetical protein
MAACLSQLLASTPEGSTSVQAGSPAARAILGLQPVQVADPAAAVIMTKLTQRLQRWADLMLTPCVGSCHVTCSAGSTAPLCSIPPHLFSLAKASPQSHATQIKYLSSSSPGTCDMAKACTTPLQTCSVDSSRSIGEGRESWLQAS